MTTRSSRITNTETETSASEASETSDKSMPPIKKPVNLNEDAEASGRRLEELKAGRHVDDIPAYPPEKEDEYWKALRKHNEAHGK